MKSKRQSRVMAMQLLYAMNQQNLPMAMVLDGVLSTMELDDNQKSYGMKLVDLVQEHKDTLKSEIESCLDRWEWERVALVDRLVMQIAWAEIKNCGDVPVKVVISEAISIAKKYSTKESPKFVNAILDRLARDVLDSSGEKI